MPKAKSSIQIRNKRASFDYEFIETYDAGIVLVGTEIKSLRAGTESRFGEKAKAPETKGESK